MLGWTVLNQLKLDPATRHIPVQIVTLEEERQHGLSHGAFSYIIKSPTTKGLEVAFDRIKDFTAPRTKRLLVVEDNDIERESIVELLGYKDIELRAVATGAEAMEAMLDQPFDCVVLDLRLPDMTGFELLGEGAGGARLERRAGGGLYRQGTFQCRGVADQGHGQKYRPERRAVAGAFAG